MSKEMENIANYKDLSVRRILYCFIIALQDRLFRINRKDFMLSLAEKVDIQRHGKDALSYNNETGRNWSGFIDFVMVVEVIEKTFLEIG